MKVTAKKHLGQHFLTNVQYANDIANTLKGNNFTQVLEIGPGKGVLTQELLPIYGDKLTVIDIDTESIAYLHKYFPQLEDRIIEADFLQMRLDQEFEEQIAITGNYPYNISSQIMFKVLDYKDQIVEVSGMFQKEVAQRIAEPEGSKQYGIISVLIQTWYDAEYLFTVGPEHFDPPPKVQSGVIRLVRNERTELPIPEKYFKRVVKQAFSQRRKTLRNSLKSMLKEYNVELPAEYQTERPEQLSVERFIKLSEFLYAASLAKQ